MNILKTIGLAFAVMGVISLSSAQSEIRKEVNVEVENGEHTLTIITTNKDGQTTTEVFKGDEAKEKMKELHANIPKDAKIEREIMKEVTDDEGNEIIIKKRISGDKDEMMKRREHHGTQMTPEEREEFHAKMKEITKNLEEKESRILHHHMRKLHHDLSPEERKELHDAIMNNEIDIDVEMDDEAKKIIIKIGDNIDEIDMKEIEQMRKMHGEHDMKMMRMRHCCNNAENCDKADKKEKVFIAKIVRIEEDNSLQNDLKGIKFNTYPNPNNGEFYIELKLDGKTSTTFKISDLKGKVVHEGEIDVTEKGLHTLPIKMRGFEKGVYLLQIEQGNKAATKRIIIE